MARACMFCGYTGKLSEEHVTPHWVIKELHKRGMSAPTDPGRRRQSLSPLGELLFGATTVDSPLSPHGLTVGRVVCKACNEGWMSDRLEGPFSELFRRMVRGEVVEAPTADECRLMAHWAVKTAMVHDVALYQGKEYSQSELHGIKDGRFPPLTDVRLGCLTGPTTTGMRAGYVTLFPTPPGPLAFGVVEFVYAGPLVFMIRRARAPFAQDYWLGKTDWFACDWWPMTPSDFPVRRMGLHSATAIDDFLDSPLLSVRLADRQQAGQDD